MYAYTYKLYSYSYHLSYGYVWLYAIKFYGVLQLHVFAVEYKHSWFFASKYTCMHVATYMHAVASYMIRSTLLPDV